MSSDKPKGWGSFMTEQTEESVEVLIHKPESEYVPPTFPIDVNVDYFVPKESQFGHETLDKLFFLDKSFTFLNHGAFGAAFRPVIEVARRWQDRMESQPLRFIDRELLPLNVYTTRTMAKFINCPPQNTVLLPNVTMGLNTIFRNLKLQKGDIIICLDLGYGATKKMLQYLVDTYDIEILELPVVFPIASPLEIVKLVRHNLRKLQKQNKLTQVKLCVFDMINSNSGLLLPIKELCQVCNEHNIDTLIDGAHTLGSIDLDILEYKCTYFLANAHKWLCSAKGAAVMYVNDTHVNTIVPAVISHGHKGGSIASEFIWQGLTDYGPWLSLTTCIDVWYRIGVQHIREYITNTCRKAAYMLMEKWNTDTIAPDSMFGPMWLVRLPGPRVPESPTIANDIQNLLYYKYNIECPIKHLQNRLYTRISCHIYNEMKDFEVFAEAMLEIRPKLEGEEDQKDAETAANAEVVKQCGGCG